MTDGTPRYYELEAFRRAVNRKIWIVVGLLGCVSVASVGLAFLVVLKPTPVIAFDGQGRAMLFDDTITPRLKLDQTRVEYFTEAFLQKYAGIDSSNLDRDLKDALNMMTPRLREVALADAPEIERRAKFKDANVRTRFDDLQIKIASYDPETAKQVHLVAWGKQTFEPRVGEVQDNEGVSQWFFSQMVLARVSVSKIAIHGVQVDYVHTTYFASEEDMRIERLKRK